MSISFSFKYKCLLKELITNALKAKAFLYFDIFDNCSQVTNDEFINEIYLPLKSNIESHPP